MDKRSYKTKKALADSLKALMRSAPFEKITVDNICANADTNRSNFYRHFQDKYDLIGWIYDDDFDYDLEEHPDWTIRDYFPLFCEKLYSDRTFYHKALQISGQNGFREHCSAWLYPILHKSWGSACRKETEEKLYDAIAFLTFDYFVDWLKEDPCTEPHIFAAQYLEDLARFGKAVYDEYTLPSENDK